MITLPVNPTFVGFLNSRVGSNWVVARRTPRVVRLYGEDVVCLSQKRYTALKQEWLSALPRCEHCGALLGEHREFYK